jgi:tetratricopeptide (TPR) repeat protein
MAELVQELSQLEREGRYEQALLGLSAFPAEVRQREDWLLFKAGLLDRLQRWEEALDTLEPVRDQPEARQFRQRCVEQQACFLEGLGQLQAAARMREVLVREAPRNVDGLVNQGIAYAQADDHERAMQYFDQALGLEANHELAWYNKGVALFDVGNLRDALGCFDKTIALNRSNAGAWHHRALCLLREAESMALPWSRNAKLEEARQCLGKALRIDPNLQEAREWLQKIQG